MRIQEVVNAIVDYYFMISDIEEASDRYGIFLYGKQGIGKSEGIKQASKEIAKKLDKEWIEYTTNNADKILANPDNYFVYIDFRLYEVVPEDLGGYPKETNGYIRYKPLEWVEIARRCHGILVLEELTNTSRLDLQANAFKIALDKKSGFTEFNKGLMVLATGNTPDVSSIANTLPKPLVNRWITIEVDITLDDWKEYMFKKYGDRFDRRVLAYLYKFKEDFIRIPEEETFSNYPTPRTWKQVAILPNLCDEFIKGLLGEEVGSKYIAFRRVNIPEVEDILKNPMLFSKASIDSKYIMSTLIGSYIREHLNRDKKLIDKIEKLFRELLNEREFLMTIIWMLPNDKRLDLASMLIKRIPELTDVLASIGDYM